MFRIISNTFHSTFIVMIILVWFVIQTLSLKEIGSIGALYDIVKSTPPSGPVTANYKQSRLTMTSKEVVLFGIIRIVSVPYRNTFPSSRKKKKKKNWQNGWKSSDFSVVIMDTAFWQKVPSAIEFGNGSLPVMCEDWLVWRMTEFCSGRCSCSARLCSRR